MLCLFTLFFFPGGFSWLGSRSKDGVVGPVAKTFWAHFMKVCKSKGATERGWGGQGFCPMAFSSHAWSWYSVMLLLVVVVVVVVQGCYMKII